MSSLPEGWAVASLGELGDWGSGGTPAKGVKGYYHNGTIPWVVIGDLNDGYVSSAAGKITEDGLRNSSAKFLPVETLLIAMYGSIGKLGITKIECATNQAIAYCKPDLSAIDLKCLFYLLMSEKSALVGQGQGGAQQNISQGILKAHEVSLAPLPEQKRIADKLDLLLARIDAARARLDRIPGLLKRFRQSVLAAATSGELTEEWRGASGGEFGQEVVKNDAARKAKMLDGIIELKKKKSSQNSQISKDHLFEIPNAWAFTSWGAVSEWITYGFTRPMPSTADGVKLLTAKDVFPFDIRMKQAGCTELGAFSALSEKDKPDPGDLLITKDGSIGRAALVREHGEFCINQSVAVCWLRSTTMNKDYLELVANTEFTQKFVTEKAKGMAIQHLSITDFAQCPIPVPSLKEQTEIVSRVETLFALADKVQSQYTAARTRIDNLTVTILAKAFRGELVPQDPNDEPASALLERLRAQRDAAPAQARRGRKPAAKH